MFGIIPSSSRSRENLRFSQPPSPLDYQGLSRSEPCRELRDGNLCFPVCWLSLELLLGLGKEREDGRICPAPRDEPAASLGMAAPFPSRASLSLVQRRVCRERKESALPGKEVWKEVLHEILLLTPLMSVGCGRHCLLLEKLVS